nr:hypothetical protein [Tanacetum cinerariifolium]
MLVIKRFSERKKVFRERKKTEKFMQRGEGDDKEFVVMGESREDLLEEDMIVMRRSEEFRREEVIMCEEYGIAGKTCGEVGGEGLVALIACEGDDKEFVVMGESREDLLEEDMIVMRRSEEFRREEVIMCEEYG